MPFQKGNTLGYKKKTSEPIEDVVTDEQSPSAPVRDELIPKQPKTPTLEKRAEEIPQLPMGDDVDFSNIYGWNMAELEFLDTALNRVPDPPKCVMEWCRSRDLVWRWLSYPSVKHLGMRGYMAYSATADIRKKMKHGDCPPTQDIDVSNKLVWREDAFLGVIPRRLHEARARSKAQRTIDQTKLAKGQADNLREVARRAGGKIVEYNVEQTARQGL
jgi:hypothetical protein